MARYVLSPEAHEDLRELRDYIARDNPTAARQVLSDLRDAMRRLAQPSSKPASQPALRSF